MDGPISALFNINSHGEDILPCRIVPNGVFQNHLTARINVADDSFVVHVEGDIGDAHHGRRHGNGLHIARDVSFCEVRLRSNSTTVSGAASDGVVSVNKACTVSLGRSKTELS